ncbi:MAG TPA: hypothetical protein HPP54_00465 [Nitrospinae bacterium]|jgi:hypothetical protein|nr:hypothetical protein [Nitrospinota bacterium]
MQCLDCGYISFKKEKACGACGFKFKNSTQSSQPLAGKESFSIFSGSVRGQSEDSPTIESVGLLDEKEPSSFIDPETGNFNLDLPATSEDLIEESQISSGSTEYEPMEFDLDKDIELEEVEGLGLEPLPETLITEEPEANTTETASISLDTAADSIEELTIDGPIAIDETASLEPIFDIGGPEEEPTISLEPALEIGEPESEEVALDLGGNEIVLDLDDSLSIPLTPHVAAPLDEIELSLEIDDSDGPMVIQNLDIPDLEIEDLDLELESSDNPEPDKP